MKVQVDGVDVFELSETQKKVLRSEIADDIFDADMKRRLHWVLMHKYENTFARFRRDWEAILIAEGATSLPTDKDEFANLVFANKNYKSRQQKEQDNNDRINAQRLEADPSAKRIPLNLSNPALDRFKKNAE